MRRWPSITYITCITPSLPRARQRKRDDVVAARRIEPAMPACCDDDELAIADDVAHRRCLTARGFQGAAYIAALSAERPELGAGLEARLAWLRERLA